MFGGCPYFLNKALDRVHSKQLRNYDPAKRNNDTQHSSSLPVSLQKHWSTYSLTYHYRNIYKPKGS